jgi:hypothetical protein
MLIWFLYETFAVMINELSHEVFEADCTVAEARSCFVNRARAKAINDTIRVVYGYLLPYFGWNLLRKIIF